MEELVASEEEKGGSEPAGEAEEEEEGFMEGYNEEEEIEECAECGVALKPGKRVAREIEGEEYLFCSQACALEFEETLAQGEE